MKLKVHVCFLRKNCSKIPRHFYNKNIFCFLRHTFSKRVFTNHIARDHETNRILFGGRRKIYSVKIVHPRCKVKLSQVLNLPRCSLIRSFESEKEPSKHFTVMACLVTANPVRRN